MPKKITIKARPSNCCTGCYYVGVFCKTPRNLMVELGLPDCMLGYIYVRKEKKNAPHSSEVQA